MRSRDPNIIYGKYEPLPQAPTDKQVEVPAEYMEFEIRATGEDPGLYAFFGHVVRTKTARNYFMFVEEEPLVYTFSVLYIGEDYVRLIEDMSDKLAEQPPFHTVHTEHLHSLFKAMLLDRAPSMFIPI